MQSLIHQRFKFICQHEHATCTPRKKVVPYEANMDKKLLLALGIQFWYNFFSQVVLFSTRIIYIYVYPSDLVEKGYYLQRFDMLYKHFVPIYKTRCYKKPLRHTQALKHPHYFVKDLPVNIIFHLKQRT